MKRALGPLRSEILAQQGAQARPAAARPFELVTIRLPVKLTFAALVLGLAFGIIAAGAALPPIMAEVAALVGGLWLRALQMTIIPLVASLLVLGLAQNFGTLRNGRGIDPVFGVHEQLPTGQNLLLRFSHFRHHALVHLGFRQFLPDR